ncbi:calcium-binding protein [Marinobacterium rhizophilum]|uniref:calcium-binding protein n=1 Tax=Marinobacterium rhizophilum TaxID=420402 RepID=UPI00047560E9|nr:calcium-binding protein [Marinobacterium rhizophilum]
MTQREKERNREDRIVMEAIVDAYGSEEQAMGWYYYLEGKISFPLKARCERERSNSPLYIGEETIVERMAPENECLREMFVMIQRQGCSLGVPLSQLNAVDAEEKTVEALGDWHYWVDRGYEFG